MRSLFYVSLLAGILVASGLNAQPDPLNGPKKDYYPNGRVSREYLLSDGVINGPYKSYTEDGKLLAVLNMVDGIQQGMQVTYFDNGQVESEINYENGLPQGVKKEYYKNGILKSHSNLTGELWELTGFSNMYFDNGKIKSETKIASGKLVIATTYDIQGRITSEQTEGHIVSHWYESDGKKHTSINGVEQK